MSQQPCPTCGGTRLCAEARNVTVGGETFPEVLGMTIEQAHEWVCSLTEGSDPHKRLTAEQLEVVGEVLKELRNRLQFMLNVGLHYLSLDRPAPTLSGGEGQRIRLASQMGCGLVGVLYILDEPSIGLHARDQRSLLDTLLQLRDHGQHRPGGRARRRNHARRRLAGRPGPRRGRAGRRGGGGRHARRGVPPTRLAHRALPERRAAR